MGRHTYLYRFRWFDLPRHSLQRREKRETAAAAAVVLHFTSFNLQSSLEAPFDSRRKGREGKGRGCHHSNPRGRSLGLEWWSFAWAGRCQEDDKKILYTGRASWVLFSMINFFFCLSCISLQIGLNTFSVCGDGHGVYFKSLTLFLKLPTSLLLRGWNQSPKPRSITGSRCSFSFPSSPLTHTSCVRYHFFSLQYCCLSSTPIFWIGYVHINRLLMYVATITCSSLLG